MNKGHLGGLFALAAAFLVALGFVAQHFTAHAVALPPLEPLALAAPLVDTPVAAKPIVAPAPAPKRTVVARKPKELAKRPQATGSIGACNDPLCGLHVDGN